MAHNQPVAFFITFTTYGTWLHGRAEGSVDREHNQWETPTLSDDYLREGGMRKAMNEDRLTLDDAMRKVVHAAITGVCEHRGRTLRALNVRTNHVHIVLGAGGIDKPEKAMNTFKSWATRRLREAHLLDEEREHVWTRHGSTRWLFHPEDAEGAADYVLNQQ